MREHDVPQFTVDAPPAGRRLRPVRGLVLHRARATPTCSPRSTSPGSRCTPPTAATSTRSWSPAGTRPSTPSRSPTSSTPRSLGDGEEAVLRDHRHRARRGRPRAARRRREPSCCCGSAADRRSSTCPPFYDVEYLPDGRIQRVVPEPPGRAVAGGQAHRHGPRRVALPEAAAGAAGRDACTSDASVEIFRGCTRGCRFCQAGMITRPVRERSASPASARWSSTACCKPPGFEEVGLLVAVERRPLRDRGARQGPGRPLRGHQHRRCPCRAPASTRSTSTSPTS